MLKDLYLKTLKLAAHKSANFFLAIVSFIESSFFPIPPDVMIVPMVIAKKNNYLKIFIIATLFSVLGGLLGYLIGSFFLELSKNIIEVYGYEDTVQNLKNRMSTTEGNLVWLATLFLAGFTPLPFKVFTITSGIIGFNIFAFFIICLISRGLRFFLVAYLSAKLGYAFKFFFEKKGALWSVIIGAGLVLIFVIIYFVLK
tara:strand:- start:104 stop:700 length:597 start_codon:yes stop_codon:yes gene_type:complete